MVATNVTLTIVFLCLFAVSTYEITTLDGRRYLINSISGRTITAKVDQVQGRNAFK